MGMPMDLLVAEASGNILVDNYMEHGLLLFDGATLWLVLGLYTGSDGKTYCNRRIKLHTNPALPLDEKFNAMFVNRTGSRVALANEHLIFVIELPNDIWRRQSVAVNPLMEHLQSSYHCRSECVGASIKSTRTAVLKIRWYCKERHDIGHRISNRLAVLYTGNIVRIYDTDVTCSTPTFLIDFKSVLGLSDLSSTRSLGIYNYIASFDFGPSFVFANGGSGKETRLKTLFAIDNDCGDIYIATYADDRVQDIQGPVALTGAEPDDFNAGDAFDMLCVQYPEKTTLPVFSLLSSRGRITHVIAIAMEQKAYEGHMEFILVSYDNLQLPCKPLADMSYCLQNDPVQPGQYFVFCAANLFSVDIRPWAYSLSNLLLSGAKLKKRSKDLLDSKVHHIFRVLGSSVTSGTQDAINTATTISTADEDYYHSVASGDGICKALDDKDIAFIAATSSKQLLSKFTMKDDIWEDRRRRAGRRRAMPVQDKAQDYLLEECLKILQSQVLVPKFRINGSVTEAEALALASRVVEALITNMKCMKTAFKKAQSIINEDLRNLEKINEEKSLCAERLLRLLSAYVDLKNRIHRIQKAVTQLKKRSDEVSSGLMPKMFPLTDAEKAMKENLETLLMDVDGIAKQLPHLANEVALKRREYFGPMRSFSASVNAQKFMLSKNTEDVNGMIRWIEQLSKKIDSVQSNVVTEESLSSSPKPRPEL